jgi:hypothetical protein
MQITVNSEIANRIEDSSSTSALSTREPMFSSRPWVETVMGTQQRKNAPKKGQSWKFQCQPRCDVGLGQRFHQAPPTQIAIENITVD